MRSSLKRASMPKVRPSSGMMGTTRGPKPSCRARLRSRRVKAMVVETSCVPEPASNSANGPWPGRGRGRRSSTGRLGSGPAQGPPPGQQVLHLGGVEGRPVEGRLLPVGQGVVGDLGLQLQPVAQRPQLVVATAS